jgi:hypothetical protein
MGLVVVVGDGVSGGEVECGLLGELSVFLMMSRSYMCRWLAGKLGKCVGSSLTISYCCIGVTIKSSFSPVETGIVFCDGTSCCTKARRRAEWSSRIPLYMGCPSQ